MTDTPRDLFITDLKNAHALESQAHEILERQADRLKNYPELARKVGEHLTETEERLRRLELCLEKLSSAYPS